MSEPNLSSVAPLSSGVPRFTLNNTTPFTYRDGLTFLEILEILKLKTNEIVVIVNDQNRVILEFAGYVESTIETLNEQYQELLTQLVGQYVSVGPDVVRGTLLSGETFDIYVKGYVDRELVRKNEIVRNIVDYGVARNSGSDQTPAIRAALDAYPRETFYFPPGNYRLNTPLVIEKENSLILDDAVLFAGQTMDTMVTYIHNNGTHLYTEDKRIIGGLFDGQNKAKTLLSLNKLMRFSLRGSTFRDGINRGIVTGNVGAEIFANDLRFYNTLATNFADNVAIESRMGDCHYTDVVIRDWTVGVDTYGSKWTRVHPWIGPDYQAAPHATYRYPLSRAFIAYGGATFTDCFSDCYRYSFTARNRPNASYTQSPILRNCFASINSNTLPIDVASANQGYALVNSDGVGFNCDNLVVSGHPNDYFGFLSGGLSRLSIRNTFSQYKVADASDYSLVKVGTTQYVSAVKIAVETFTSQLSDGITGSLSTNSCRYSARADGTVQVNMVLSGNVSGNGSDPLGFTVPLPAGFISLRPSPMSVHCTGVTANSALFNDGVVTLYNNGVMVKPSSSTPVFIVLSGSIFGVLA